MGDKVVINIKTFVDGHAPLDRVLDAMFCSSEATWSFRRVADCGYHV